MKRRHLIAILFIATSFFLSAGFALANGEGNQAAPVAVAESAPTLEDGARLEELAVLLGQSTTGGQLLELKEAYQVNVRFVSGQGSSFNQAANRIRLDSSMAPLKAALIFAHEMHHARTFHEGKKAHRRSLSRQVYVTQMLWDESQAMAVSIQLKMELEENGVDVTGASMAFEDDYIRAYRIAAAQARLSDASADAQQLDAIGQEAGVQALYETHLRGETRTANTKEACRDYYGRQWDEANPIKALLASLFSDATPSAAPVHEGA
ncbi:MAG: DUF6782 family putative metallopeptidase [Candidatus Promineifilaceae bacterium]|nr:DUF6782 family putative metallopeptidase [Candidatus Promineifilaceae bacterium]